MERSLQADGALVLWANAQARRVGWLRLVVAGLARWLAAVEIGLMLLLLPGGRRGSAVRMLLAVGLVYLACDVLGRVWPRQRPFAQMPQRILPLIEHAASRSFPSRHVASGLAMAAIGGLAHPRLGSAMTLTAWVLGVTRVAAGLHFPSDVLGGAVVGLVIGWCFTRRM